MPFKEGHKHSKGRPKINPVLKEVMAVNRELVEEKLAQYMTMSFDKIKEITKDDKKSTMDHMLASIVVHGVISGDPKHLSFLLDRTIGKVKDVQEVDVTLRKIEEVHANIVKELPREQLIQLARVTQRAGVEE
jgi:hypothetical protein